jgi:glycosyltransferase involved in cell wall biosynthesis
MRAVVAQKGAREHFLAARALHRHRALVQVVVDWYAPGNQIFRRLCSLSGAVGAKSAQAARADEIPDSMVRPFRLAGLWWKWSERIAARRRSAYGCFLKSDTAFARKISRLRLPPHDVFFGYSYASLEVLQIEKERGVFTVLDQIDPGPFEFRLVAEEMRQHPEIAGPAPGFPAAYYERVRREWEVADVILVNSEWSREAIISEGASPNKIEVLSLAYEADAQDGHEASLTRNASNKLLRVLWLGQINVRKGIYYLVQAARLLEREPVQVLVTGPLQIHREFLAAAPANIRWLGPIPRNRVAQLYHQADVFLLPTLSDGFAITQLEAMTYGLPVITTPNCGRVVEHGRTGFIVPPRDAVALADAILRFVADPELAAAMAPRCREAAKSYSIEDYGNKLVEIVPRRESSFRS